MTWVKIKHKCPIDDAINCLDEDIDAGDKWKCDDCGRIWKMMSPVNHRGEWFAIKTSRLYSWVYRKLYDKGYV